MNIQSIAIDEVASLIKVKEIFHELFPTEEIIKKCKPIIAGGIFSSLLDNRKINDVDIFVEDTKNIVKHFSKNKKIKKLFENDLVINYKYKDLKLQVIKKYLYSNYADVVEVFDFTIVGCCYIGDGMIYYNDRFFIDNAQKKLVISRLTQPLSTLQRTYKYTKRGYNLCPIGLLNIIKAITELNIDWKNPDENLISFYADKTPKFKGID